jgi:hypothetical protein
MGAQPTKVQSSLEMLRGTPIEVWNKTESRWVKAVIGAQKDVREAPPDPTAVLVLYQEAVRGRTDAYKWIRQEDIYTLIRARPESLKQAGMLDSMMESFGTMFDNRSSFHAALTAPQHAPSHGSIAPSMVSIPVERAQAVVTEQSMLVTDQSMYAEHPMNSAMAAPSARPVASFASTVDQNSLGQQHRWSSMASTVPEDRAGFMGNLMPAIMASNFSNSGQQYNPNVHLPSPAMDSQMGSTFGSHMQSQSMYSQMPPNGGGGIMASLMGMGPANGGGAGSHAGSVAESMVIGENRSPNRSPMSSMAGSAKGSVYGSMTGSHTGKVESPAPGPMGSMMNSMFARPGQPPFMTR